MISALLIAGPTASGKSALAISLARKLGGAVINADSMQVYADLHVLSARPAPAEMASAPHLLFGHVEGAVNYSVGRWLEDAAAAIASVRAQGLLPVITGGTGLYFKALTQGLSEIPAVPAEIRAQVRAEAEGATPPELHAKLAALDPIMAAKLRLSDPQRILRALEILAATGQSLASFQGARSAPLLADAAGIFLAADRAELGARINRRFDAMVAGGALEEVRALMQRGLDPALPVMRAHGVPALAAHVRGELPLEAACEIGRADTRAYARRQYTFARNQLTQFMFVAPELAEAAALQLAGRP